MSESEVIAKALVNGGGITAVARALGMSEEGVRLWRARGRVPASRVIELERLSGIPRDQLRPDLYTQPEAA